MKRVIRFCMKRMLSPRLVPYKILKRICKEAYELDLATVHSVFHLMLLKMCVGDPASVVPLDSMAVKDSLSFYDVPIQILDLQVRRLRNNEVASVTILWRSPFIEGATWEAEVGMKANYPHLFRSDSTPT